MNLATRFFEPIRKGLSLDLLRSIRIADNITREAFGLRLRGLSHCFGFVCFTRHTARGYTPAFLRSFFARVPGAGFPAFLAPDVAFGAGLSVFLAPKFFSEVLTGLSGASSNFSDR